LTSTFLIKLIMGTKWDAGLKHFENFRIKSKSDSGVQPSLPMISLLNPKDWKLVSVCWMLEKNKSEGVALNSKM